MNKSMEEKDPTLRLQWGGGRVAFLAQQEQIKNMLAAGHPQRAIYKTLQIHLNNLSYSQFSHLVRKNITAKSKPKERPPSTNATTPLYENQKREPASKSTFRTFHPGPRVPDINELF